MIYKRVIIKWYITSYNLCCYDSNLLYIVPIHGKTQNNKKSLKDHRKFIRSIYTSADSTLPPHPAGSNDPQISSNPGSSVGLSNPLI